MPSKLNGKRRRNGNDSVRLVYSGRHCLLCNEPFLPEGEEVVCKSCAEKNGINIHKRKKGYPVNRRKICQTCAHKVMLGNQNYVCDCLCHTGKIRDLAATDSKCRTYERRGVRQYDDD